MNIQRVIRQRRFWYRCGYATGFVAFAFLSGLLYIANKPSNVQPQIRLRVVK